MTQLPDPLGSPPGTEPGTQPGTTPPRSHSPVPNAGEVKTVTLHVHGDDPRGRGLQRASQAGARIRATVRGYDELFAHFDIPAAEARQAGRASLAALREWDPAQFDELSGVAAGAGIQPADLASVVARTEILTLSTKHVPECSTIAYQSPGATVAAQTWDWHGEFANCWHYQRVTALPGEYAYAGFAEYGMLGKIGINAAGVGVLLNILNHVDDAPGGVPIHAVLAGVLARSGNAAEAVDIIRSARTSSSSVITVVDPDRAVMVEIGPHGKGEWASEGFVCHTNHFQVPELQEGGRPLSPTSRSEERLESVETAAASAAQAGVAPPRNADALLPLLATDPAAKLVSQVPDPHAPFGERTATLVTARLDPAAHTVRMSPGIPQLALNATSEFVL